MIETPKTKRLAAVTLLLAGLALISSLVGLISPQIYAPFVDARFLPALYAQDIVSLLVAIGLFFVLRSMRRGAPRCAWIWSGLVAYQFYAYAVLSFERVYTPLYPVYLAIFGLSLFGLGLLYTSLQPEALTLATYARQPRTLFALYLLANAAVHALIWIPLVLKGIGAKQPPPGNSIFVLDLTLFIPLMLVGVVQIWKKTLLGHSLAGLLLIKAGVLGGAVFIGQLLMPRHGMVLEFWPALLAGLLAVGGLLLSILFLARLQID